MRIGQAGQTRPGTAEIVGSVLSIALTIIAGFAVLAYVNGEAKVSEGLYGQSVGQTVNYLQENFVVIQINYNYPGSPNCASNSRYCSTSITLYFYNDGGVTNQFQQIEVYNSTRSKLDLTFTGSYVTDLNNPTNCKVAATTSLESPLLGTGTGSLAVTINSISTVTLTLPSCYTNKGTGYQFYQSDFYFVNVLGVYGNLKTYNQEM